MQAPYEVTQQLSLSLNSLATSSTRSSAYLKLTAEPKGGAVLMPNSAKDSQMVEALAFWKKKAWVWLDGWLLVGWIAA